MKILKINPKDLEGIAEDVARKLFIGSIQTMEEGETTDIFIRTNYKFKNAKTEDGCLIILGEQKGGWINTVKQEFNADKKRILIGTVTKRGSVLYIFCKKGNGKPTIINKQAKVWINKAGVTLNYNAFVEEKTDTIETDFDVQPTSNKNLDENALNNFNKDARSVVKQLMEWNKLKGQAKNIEAVSLKSILPMFIEQGEKLRTELSSKEIEVLDKATVVLEALLKAKTPTDSINVKESKTKAKAIMDELSTLIESYQSLS
jgi:hypothetical protein